MIKFVEIQQNINWEKTKVMVIRVPSQQHVPKCSGDGNIFNISSNKSSFQ